MGGTDCGFAQDAACAPRAPLDQWAKLAGAPPEGARNFRVEAAVRRRMIAKSWGGAHIGAQSRVNSIGFDRTRLRG